MQDNHEGLDVAEGGTLAYDMNYFGVNEAGNQNA